MSEKEYQKYDSDVTMECRNIRLTHDPKVVNDTFVKATFCITSKNPADEEVWIDAIPTDGGAEQVKLLRKGDVMSVSGFPTVQRWGDNNDKVSHTLKHARFHYPISLLVELKKRAEETGAQPAAKKTFGKAFAKPNGAPKRKALNLDEMGDDL